MKKSNVYTLTGDSGTTSLVGGQRIKKCDIRLDAYGTVDELNSYIGLLINRSVEFPEMIKLLRVIQNKLFNIGAYLATPNPDKKITTVNGLSANDVTVLERAIDEMDENLPPLSNFILPGGSFAASWAHVCRTVTRRCERCILELAEETYIDPVLLKYMNRLSDFFFVYSRYANIQNNNEEIFWNKNC